MANKPPSATNKKAPQQTLKEKRAAKREKTQETNVFKPRKGA
ncbi:hypothetical protein NQ152_11200 [Microbacterium sp. zg.B48]|nr:hypothetical protein [Microbacterium sp. zg.B48]MCR2764071.1 hypothetical protein [Microbacterium sp. zg.B48]